MTRQAFTPPEDDDDILSTLTGAPPSRSAGTPQASAAARQGTEVNPLAGGAKAQMGAGERRSPGGVLPPTPAAAATTTPPSAPTRPTQAIRDEASPAASSGGLKSETALNNGEELRKTAIKRIGLYIDTPRWLWLKKLSVQRAERGLPPDFTSIFLEALDEKYRR
jgi:hypothetical protein